MLRKVAIIIELFGGGFCLGVSIFDVHLQNRGLLLTIGAVDFFLGCGQLLLCFKEVEGL